jgi:transcriptional regulator of acetoin/glycerol metabolism
MPVPTNPRLSALWITNPEEAAFEVRLALDAEGGNVELAAKRLGISRRTMYRYLEKGKPR